MNTCSENLKNILIWWGGNSYFPEHGKVFFDTLSPTEIAALDEEMQLFIGEKLATAIFMDHMTSMGFPSDEKAGGLFAAIYEYLFKSAPEPNIEDFIRA